MAESHSGCGGAAANKKRRSWHPWVIPAAFFAIEVFGYVFLLPAGETLNLWPLVFGLLWAGILGGAVLATPTLLARFLFALLYFPMTLYAAVQTGYYHMFHEMMWLSEFRYASEGLEFASVLLEYPVRWWIFVLGSLTLGVLVLWRFPVYSWVWRRNGLMALVAVSCALGALALPRGIFLYDRQTRYAASDFGRSRSAEAVYTNMFNAHGLYQVCGVYQTAMKDIWRTWLYPLTPGYTQQRQQGKQRVSESLAGRGQTQQNDMTGVFAGKNVIVVLMESMDDWVIGTHTPTINRLMEEGIQFTNFYTPLYGGVRTFNTEFCVNTGSFLSSAGGYAFDYVTNDYSHSLANQLGQAGYSSKVYHYNTPSFYSRGVFSGAFGYEAYMSYAAVGGELSLYDELFLFEQEELYRDFFREGATLNFVITRSAHMSYRYSEPLSAWGLQKYPQYRGLTGSEEGDCMYVKARLVDDFFARLMQELQVNGQLDNTVIVGVTDHYTYGFQDTKRMMERSGVDHELLLEKTPCFIWSADGISMDVDKVLNTSDLLPTLLNMLGIAPQQEYLGQDAFDPNYVGYAIFPNGSWICQGAAYWAPEDKLMILEEGTSVTENFRKKMDELANKFVSVNNLILETDYYAN